MPTECPHCGECCGIVNNSEIYGREYGEWPWAVLCSGCRAYVGLHPFTGIPLGTLATEPIRKARSAAKDEFNKLWQRGAMTRSAAYAWLAGALGIANVNECHIGWFDVAQCDAVIAAVKQKVSQ
nr:zinc-finger-containing protein [Rhodoferax sp. TH121]